MSTFVAISEDTTSLTPRTLLLNVITFLTSALALTTAFAWNDATRAYFDRFPSLRKRGVWTYALVVTVISVVGVTAMVWLRAAAAARKEEEIR